MFGHKSKSNVDKPEEDFDYEGTFQDSIINISNIFYEAMQDSSNVEKMNKLIDRVQQISEIFLSNDPDLPIQQILENNGTETTKLGMSILINLNEFTNKPSVALTKELNKQMVVFVKSYNSERG